MKKKRSLRQPLGQCCLIIALTCAILLGGLPSVPSFAAGTTYYVSETTGDDARTPQQATDRTTPWKTIQKAADTLTAGDTCIILAGTYRETVTPANSGTPGNPITFKADTGATVVISGLEEVTGQWTVHSGSVYKTTAPLTLGDDNQLFVDGQAMMLARWPNSTGNDWALNPTYALCEANTNLSTIYNASIPNIDWTGGKIFHTPINNKGWASWETTILGSAPGSVNFNAPLQPHWDRNGSRQGTQFYLSNKLAVLDSDNEWYFEASTNTLYLQMKNGADPNSAKVEYKSRVYGLDLKGKGFINVEGIDLFGTTLVTDGTTNNSTIDAMKAYHIWGTREVGNNHYAHVTNPYSGIALLGENLTIKNSEIAYSDGNGIIVAGKNNNIINNHIHDVNYKGCYAAGVYLMGERNLISHNTITRTGRSNITGNLGFKDCVIQYNDLSSPGHKTRDGGVMYFSWVNGGHSEIHHNVIHDGRTEAGIYVDNNTHGLTIYNNLVYNASNSANGAYCFGGPNEYVSFINNTSHDKGILQGGWPPKNGSDYLGSYYINNISVDGLFKAGEISYLSNHIYGYISPGFTDVANKDFTLVAGAATVDSGRFIEGISEGYQGFAPDKGAFERGVTPWQAGHNFSAPPNPTLSFSQYIYRNLVENPGFDTNSMAGWTVSGGNVSLQSDQLQTGWGSNGGLTSAGPYALVLGAGANSIEQTISGLKPSSKYRASVWVKVGAGEQATFGAKDFGGTTKSVNQSASDFVRKELIFVTGDTATSATLFLQKTSTSSGQVVVDDVALQYMGDASKDNMAAEATVTTSTDYSADYVGSKINDDDMDTRWSARDWNDQWVQFTFSSARDIEGVEVDEATDFGNRINAYKIQYHDGTGWQDLATGTGIGAHKVITFNKVTTDKIRLYVVTASEAPTIYEMRIMGEALENLAESATATASTTWSSAYTPDKAKDNLLSTRWASNQNNNQWLEFSFATPVDVNHVVLRECIDYGQRVQSYKIQHYSNNTWVDLATGTTMGTRKTHDFAVTTVSKIRLFVDQASGPPTLWEMGLYRK